MKISIGSFDAETRSVPVVFEQNDVRYQRSAYARLDAAGGYDAAATATRVDEVALGVAQQIALGMIVTKPLRGIRQHNVNNAATREVGTRRLNSRVVEVATMRR